MERYVREGPKSTVTKKTANKDNQGRRDKNNKIWGKGMVKFYSIRGVFFIPLFHQYKYREENTVQMEGKKKKKKFYVNFCTPHIHLITQKPKSYTSYTPCL